jgi:hypothetical protein
MRQFSGAMSARKSGGYLGLLAPANCPHRYSVQRLDMVTEAEENLALALLDPLGDLATKDEKRLEKLLKELDPGDMELWDCIRDAGNRDSAIRNCTSAKRAIPICGRCWCRERSTFWDRSASIAISDAGIKAGRARWAEWQETSHRGHGKKAGGVAASSVGERRSVRAVAQ